MKNAQSAPSVVFNTVKITNKFSSQEKYSLNPKFQIEEEMDHHPAQFRHALSEFASTWQYLPNQHSKMWGAWA